MMRSWRVAVVGLGNAGTTLHLPALAGLERAHAVGGCDPEGARRSAAAGAWGVPVFETFEEMMDRTDPEVVIVATPPGTHLDYCLAALARGCHVICEKPFASSVEEAERIIAAAHAAGRRVALNHEFRAMPIFRAVLDPVRREEDGRLNVVQVWQLMDLPPWAEPGWRGQMLQRTLYEAGVHLVDYVMALFGGSPRAVQAWMSSSGARDDETDAVAMVTLEFPGGGMAQITQNRLCKGATQYFEVRADAERASYRASFGGRARLSAGLFRSTRPHVRWEFGVSGLAWREAGASRRILARNPKDPGMVATRMLIDETLAAFEEGGPAPADAELGRDVLHVIAACYHAAARGSRVDVDAAGTPALANLHMGEAPTREPARE